MRSQSHHFKLVRTFIKASIQREAAYQANFAVSILHSLLNFGTGVLGLAVLFNQIDDLHGWSYASTLAVLGTYLTVNAIRDLFISPSLDSLTGMDGEVWQGTFDFTLLRPVDIQFLASVREWRPFALLDLFLGLGVLAVSITQLEALLTIPHLLSFLSTLFTAILIIYAILLIFAGLVFWSPGFLFTWVFNGIFQMARYPIGLYPGWLRLVLTWIIPVGLITTVPAQALTGSLSGGMLIASVLFSLLLVILASFFFRQGIKRYASASS